MKEKQNGEDQYKISFEDYESHGITLFLTLGAAVDSKLLERSGLALTGWDGTKGLSEWDSTKGTELAERDGETFLGQVTVDASQGRFLHILLSNLLHIVGKNVGWELISSFITVLEITGAVTCDGTGSGLFVLGDRIGLDTIT